jgi:hypothetical protein
MRRGRRAETGEETAMTRPYTLATYRVMPGREEAFIAAWADLAAVFAALPSPPYWGTLIRSASDPSLFHSFGPWERAEDVRAMRAHPQAGAAFAALGALCREMNPGDYEVVLHVAVRAEPGPGDEAAREA